MSKHYRLCISILNYRTPELTIECLASIAGQIDATSECAVVLDNGSGDDSCEKLSAAIEFHGWSDWASLIAANSNGGFSAGQNHIIRATDARNYLLLNSDAQLLPGTLASLRQAAEDHPQAGAITSRLEAPGGAPLTARFRFPSAMNEFLWSAASSHLMKHLGRFVLALPSGQEYAYCEWICFTCVLLRGEALNEVGLLDEGFFLYYEDVDYCRRLQQKDWRVLYWPDAGAVHLHASRGTDSEVASRTEMSRVFFQSRTRYFLKHHGRAGLVFANVLWLLGRALSLPREWLGIKPRHTAVREASAIWTDWWRPLKRAETAAADRLNSP